MVHLDIKNVQNAENGLWWKRLWIKEKINNEKSFKNNWKFLLLVLIGGLVGGYCIGLYSYDSLSNELLKQLQDQNVTKEMVAISSMIQYGMPFGVILVTIGIIISQKIQLWAQNKNSKIAFSTTNYHVFRVGNIAFNQKIKLEGIGSKTKRYFWINAFIREFIATIYSEKRKHITILSIILLITIIITFFKYIEVII